MQTSQGLTRKGVDSRLSLHGIEVLQKGSEAVVLSSPVTNVWSTRAAGHDTLITMASRSDLGDCFTL